MLQTCRQKTRKMETMTHQSKAFTDKGLKQIGSSQNLAMQRNYLSYHT